MNLTQHILTIIDEMRSQIAFVDQTFSLMPALISEEHAAISRSDLETIETIARRKLELSSELESCYAHLRQQCQQVRDAAELQNIATKDAANNVSGTFLILERILEKLDSTTSAYFNLVAGVERLKTQFELFLQTKKSGRRAVEVNKLVLGKLLSQRQANYQFWQELTADTMAAYDRGGKQKAHRSHSAVSVKA